MKFTFNTYKPTGKYRSFKSVSHSIKLKGNLVGKIDNHEPYKIRLMVIKKDINEDGNPSCKWKWITLKQESITIDEAKEFLNHVIEVLVKKYDLHYSE